MIDLGTMTVDIFGDLGYQLAHDKREDFFEILEEEPPFKFRFVVSLKSGMVEFIWSVLKNGELEIGGPLDMIKETLDEKDERVRLPIFRNYDDLKEILTEAFSMYEDLKLELTATGDK